MKAIVTLWVWLNIITLWLIPACILAAVLWGLGVPQQAAFVSAIVIVAIVAFIWS